MMILEDDIISSSSSTGQALEMERLSKVDKSNTLAQQTTLLPDLFTTKISSEV